LVIEEAVRVVAEQERRGGEERALAVKRAKNRRWKSCAGADLNSEKKQEVGRKEE